jgi:hypothetical protein
LFVIMPPTTSTTTAKGTTTGMASATAKENQPPPPPNQQGGNYGTPPPTQRNNGNMAIRTKIEQSARMKKQQQHGGRQAVRYLAENAKHTGNLPKGYVVVYDECGSNTNIKNDGEQGGKHFLTTTSAMVFCKIASAKKRLVLQQTEKVSFSYSNRKSGDHSIRCHSERNPTTPTRGVTDPMVLTVQSIAL